MPSEAGSPEASRVLPASPLSFFASWSRCPRADAPDCRACAFAEFEVGEAVAVHVHAASAFVVTWAATHAAVVHTSLRLRHGVDGNRLAHDVLTAFVCVGTAT